MVQVPTARDRLVFTYRKFCDQSRGKVVGEGGKSRIAVTFEFNETTTVSNAVH